MIRTGERKISFGYFAFPFFRWHRLTEKYRTKQEAGGEVWEAGKECTGRRQQEAYNARKREWMERCGENKAGKISNADIVGMAYAVKEVVEVHSVGKIDMNIYKCVTEDIVTDEVIITDERIQHIKERHPDDYERFCGYIPDIIADPDYIIEANKPNTAVILKEIIKDGENFN